VHGVDDPARGLGHADRRVQAYNYRLCVTDWWRINPFCQAEGYEESRYELLLRTMRRAIRRPFEHQHDAQPQNGHQQQLCA
jgi:hypothetical protein